MPYQPFTREEIRLIFQLSEGPTGGGGHAGAQHVNKSKEQLWQRVQSYQGAGLALRTSFLTFADQIEAAFEVLNDPRNDAALEDFRVNAKAGDRGHFDMKNLPLRTPVRMHYGIGGGAQLFPCSLVTLVLHKNLARPRGMHVVTFFGTMGPLV